MKRRLSLALLLAAAGVAGCDGATPGVYALSVSEAYQRLLDSKLPELVFRRQCGILIHVTPSGLLDQEVTWRVHSSGRKVAEFTAILTPTDEGETKVEIKLPPGPKGGEAYDGNQFYRRPAFNQPLRPAVEEQVAALLEGRAYDVTRVPVGTDSVCDVQRGGLESGTRFRVDDPA